MNMPPVIEVNMIAVFLGAVLSMALGAIWYSPKVFGNTWMKATGKTPESCAEMMKKNMALSYALQFIGVLVTAYVLAHLAGYANAETALAGMQAGFWVWLGFMFPLSLSAKLWDNQPWTVIGITSGYNLASMLIIGAVIGGM